MNIQKIQMTYLEVPSDIYFNILLHLTSQSAFLNLRAVARAALIASFTYAKSPPLAPTSRVKINITNENINLAFLKKYSKIINWRSLEVLRLHSDIIIEFVDHLNINTLISKTVIPSRIILANKHRINPNLLFAHQRLDIETIDALHADSWIPWQFIHSFATLDQKILEKYARYINWNAMPVNNIIPEKIIERFADNFNWGVLIKTQNISKNLLLVHADKYNINSAIMYQEIPEELIDMQIGGIDWCIYSRYQNITPEIRKKYDGLICYRCLAHNRI